MLQIPHLHVDEEVKRLKGSALTAADNGEVEARIELAKKWLSDYAPEHAKFEIQKKIPAAVRSLSGGQRKFLSDVADVMNSKDWQGEELHSALHELRKKSTLEPKDAFGALYIALLGKDSGPQAGWFLEALDKEFVTSRFRECGVK